MLGLGLGQFVPYVIYGISIPIAFVTAFYRSAVGLLLVLPLLPLYAALDKVLKSDLPFANNVVDFMVVAMLLGMLLQKRDEGLPSLQTSPNQLPLVIFAGYTFISLMLGTGNFDGLTGEINMDRYAHWKNFMLMPLLYIIAYYSLRDIKWQKNLFYLLFIAFIVSDLRFRQSFQWFKRYHYQGVKSRVGGLAFLGPNEVAAFHAIYTLFVMGLFFVDKNIKRRIAYVLFIVGSTYCVLYSYSRGAYIALVLTSIFIAFVRERWLIVVLVAFFISWKSILPVSVVERIENTIVEEESRKDTIEVGGVQLETAQRTEIWSTALGYFYENPITGKGYNTYQYLTGWDTHNVYLKFMAEQGLIGIVIYLWLYVLALRSGWRLYKKANEELLQALGFGFVCAVVASMIVNFFGDRWTYFQIGGIYWVLWALVDQHNALCTLKESTGAHESFFNNLKRADKKKLEATAMKGVLDTREAKL